MRNLRYTFLERRTMSAGAILLVLQVGLLACRPAQATSVLGPIIDEDGSNHACYSTADTLCANANYQTAGFPNFRNHYTPAEASSEMDDFLQVGGAQCSPAAVHFLCSYYFPFCSSDEAVLHAVVIIPPCRSLCQLVYQQCAHLLLMHGSQWPPFLNCSLFPVPTSDAEEEESPLCYGPQDPSTLQPIAVPGFYTPLPPLPHPTPSPSPSPSPATSSVLPVPSTSSPSAPPTTLTTAPSPTPALPPPPSPSSSPSPSPSSSPSPSPFPSPSPHQPPTLAPPVCTRLTAVEFCKDLGYANTSFPNLFGQSQLEAESRLEEYQLLVDMQCSQALLHLLCYFYAPECLPASPSLLRPCKHLCLFVRSECEPVMEGLQLHWPDALSCETLPSSNSSETLCSGTGEPSDLTLPPTTSTSFSGAPSPLPLPLFLVLAVAGSLQWST